jgi:prolyl oligopeptidase
MRAWVLIAVLGCSSPAAPPVVEPTPQPEPTPARVPTKPPTTDPTVARVEDVVDTQHGMTVHDPYRWMEKGGAELDGFFTAQDKKARDVFAAIPGRAKLREEIRVANRGITRVSVATIVGTGAKPRIFIMRREPDEDQRRLFVRDGWDGKDKLLIDPHARDTKDVHHSIDYATPSPDGKHVAYGISASGSEDSTIEVIEVDTGKVLAEKMNRAQYASIDWRDNKSFYYWRRRQPAPTDTKADWFKHSAAYLHTIGEDPEKSTPIVTAKMLGVADESFVWVSQWSTSPWVIAGASPGTSAGLELFAARAKDIKAGAKIEWRRLSGPKDGIYDYSAYGDTLFTLSYANAMRYQIVGIDLKAGTAATAKVVVPEKTMVLESLVGAKDGLYLQYLDGGLTKLERMPWGAKKTETIALPFAGSGNIWGHSDRAGVMLSLEGWIEPYREFLVEPKKPVRDLKLRAPWPFDSSRFVAEEVEVTSADGTKVPLSIVHRKDLARDGQAPAYLGAYQAYGSVSKPGFSPIDTVWMERGVTATCHGRGSGDRGKQWHLDGIKTKKENGVDDLIACATYLVENKYTSSPKLTVEGTSAGGVLVGGALTKRPDLFGVGLLRVPMVNLSRFETTEGGPANVPEFGSLANAEEYKYIIATDPYHRIKEGTAYPPMLITAGRHDVRVPAWIPAKFAAKIQAASSSGRDIVLRVEGAAGHGIGSTRTQVEEEWTDLFAFALSQSGVAIK